MLLVIKRK